MTTPSSSVAPFSVDALNRYRLIHTDRDVRPVIRRLNKLPFKDLPDKTREERDEESLAIERENVRLDAERWKFGIERTIASLRNLERQRDTYVRKTEETAARTEALRQTLAEEKALLAKRLAERDNRVKCDEVAKKIIARGKTRKELAEQIAALETSITEHRAAYEAVIAVGQARNDTFAKIVTLVEECRALQLPAGASPEPLDFEKEEAKKEAAATATKLSATSLPFQPSSTPSSLSAPALHAPRAPVSAPASRATTPAPAHGLPSRPTRSISQTSSGRTTYPRAPASLPPRPSNLRNVRGGSGLEDGEVGEEDGEVKEGMKRKAAEMDSAASAAPTGRSTRRK